MHTHTHTHTHNCWVLGCFSRGKDRHILTDARARTYTSDANSLRDLYVTQGAKACHCKVAWLSGTQCVRVLCDVVLCVCAGCG